MSEPLIISSPHLHQARSVAQVMRQVIYALLPGILISAWVFGAGVLIQCVFAVGFALALEMVMLKLRGRSLHPFLYDGSAVVTALLFALCISPYTPIWVNFLGIAFAIVIAKHVYGGIGNNLFNPAMAGYIFVLLCFPAVMATWPLATGEHPGLAELLQIIFTGNTGIENFDAVSGPTALAYTQSQLRGMSMLQEIRTSPLFGSVGGKGSEWIAAAWLAGGVWLIMQKIISWRLPAYFLGTLLGISLIFHGYDTDLFLPPLLTLFTGGIMLAAFFIITDPVTASTTPRGRIIYVCGIALLAWLIRTFGGYPDGVAFAVLLMNAAVPLIDQYTRPPAFGERRV